MLLFSFLEVHTVETPVHCHFGHSLAPGTVTHSALLRSRHASRLLYPIDRRRKENQSEKRCDSSEIGGQAIRKILLTSTETDNCIRNK